MLIFRFLSVDITLEFSFEENDTILQYVSPLILLKTQFLQWFLVGHKKHYFSRTERLVDIYNIFKYWTYEIIFNFSWSLLYRLVVIKDGLSLGWVEFYLIFWLLSPQKTITGPFWGMVSLIQ